jgi:HD-GYP domain-containing protein (c-di-GMP phosphodiesterase class II)
MTTERPYRKAMTSFKALELLKKVLSDEYPQEFKTLVFFLKNFFSK